MRNILLLGLLTFVTFFSHAQSGKEFWLAPPDVTYDHHVPGGVPIYLNISTFGQAATVTIDQPANSSFTPIVLNLAANVSHQEDLTLLLISLRQDPQILY